MALTMAFATLSRSDFGGGVLAGEVGSVLPWGDGMVCVDPLGGCDREVVATGKVASPFVSPSPPQDEKITAAMIHIKDEDVRKTSRRLMLITTTS